MPPSRLSVLPAPLLFRRLRDRSASASACAAASAGGRAVGLPPNFRMSDADEVLRVVPWLLTDAAAESRVVRLNGGGCPGAIRGRDDDGSLPRLSAPIVVRKVDVREASSFIIPVWSPPDDLGGGPLDTPRPYRRLTPVRVRSCRPTPAAVERDDAQGASAR